MSLINDALKRAREAQQQLPSPLSPGPQLRPIEPAQQARHGLGLLVPVGLGVIALLGLFLVWQAAQGRGSIQVSAPKVPAAAKTGSHPMPPPAPAQAAPSSAASIQAPEPTPVAAQSPPPQPIPPVPAVTSSNTATATTLVAPATPAPAALETAATNTPALTEPVTPPPAPLKLQAIVFNPPQPSAIINGKTVFVGDYIREFQVLAISQTSATLADGGHTNVLRLPD
jgi:hypothetical protein